MAEANFENWRLEVGGLVENPLQLGLADLRAMRAHSQVTLHHCIQGWSGVAQWTGVAVTDILARCRPLANARYAVFRSWQEPEPGTAYYEAIDLELASHAQTILAYEMNDAPLQVSHGAPCRLRVETQLGFKMVKWVRSIELVEDYRMLGEGQGGYREDVQFYGPEAESDKWLQMRRDSHGLAFRLEILRRSSRPKKRPSRQRKREDHSQHSRIGPPPKLTHDPKIHACDPRRFP